MSRELAIVDGCDLFISNSCTWLLRCVGKYRITDGILWSSAEYAPTTENPDWPFNRLGSRDVGD